MDPSWMCDRIRVVCGRRVGEAAPVVNLGGPLAWRPAGPRANLPAEGGLTDAEPRRERAPDQNRAGHRDGRPDPAILDPGAGVEGARAGWAREAGDAARRAAGGLPRPERPGRPDRRVLPPPRGFLLLWARRGEW